jgi:hypothetical protein
VGEYLQVSLLERILGNFGVRLPSGLDGRRSSPVTSRPTIWQEQ